MTIQERMDELEELAKEEDIAINPKSFEDLTKILNRPLIYLMDNGNYRLRLKFKNVSVGIDLLGGDEADVVVI